MIAPMRYSGERRDVQRAIDHWRQNTWGEGCVPLLDTFDFSPMRGEWGSRFLICGSYEVEAAVFVTYGSGFAELLDLPEEPVTNIPFIRQIPKPCRTMFSDGYSKAILESKEHSGSRRMRNYTARHSCRSCCGRVGRSCSFSARSIAVRSPPYRTTCR